MENLSASGDHRIMLTTLFTKPILDKVKELTDLLSNLPDDDRIGALNLIKTELHRISPMSSEPVDCVLWIKADSIRANDYNPNSVAPPEMKLLAHSIIEDGYTQPIVTWTNESVYEVVDGYHRNRVGREIPEVRERIHGYLPITVVNDARTDRGDRIAATIRHNRARGKHRIDAMSEIVIELKRRNWSDEKIGRELGMDPDEVLRLTQITGLAEMFANRDFSQAWEAGESNEINDTDNLRTDEENLSPLGTVGGLAGRDVPGDSVSTSPVVNRRGGKAPKNAGAIEVGNAQGSDGVADSHRSKSKQRGKKPAGVVGSSGDVRNDEGSGLPHETGVAHPLPKPAGRSKRRSRRGD